MHEFLWLGKQWIGEVLCLRRWHSDKDLAERLELHHVRMRAGAIRDEDGVAAQRVMVSADEPMPEPFLVVLDRRAGIVSPRMHGFDTVDTIHAMARGKVKVFFALGGNFAQATPDSRYAEAALRRCRLTCQASTKLNRSHLIHGRRALILPCLGRSDDDGGRILSFETSMGVVQSTKGGLEPVSTELLSEPEIVARLGDAVLGDVGNIRWCWLAEDYDRIRTWIEAVVPGFEDYNARLREPGGFYLPNAAKERVWRTAGGKAEFSSAAIDAFEVKEGRLILQTLRSHDQFNTTVYGLDDRYRGIGHSREIVFLNPRDMEERGLRPMERLRVTSHWEDGERDLEGFAAVPYEMPRGMAAMYFPEANALVPAGSVAEGSNTPTSKSVEISIRTMG